MTKIKRHCQDNMEVYQFVSRTKTRYKIATMNDILIIYSSKGVPIEKTSEAVYIRKMHLKYPLFFWKKMRNRL